MRDSSNFEMQQPVQGSEELSFNRRCIVFIHKDNGKFRVLKLMIGIHLVKFNYENTMKYHEVSIWDSAELSPTEAPPL
jgi:hypothetical protein